MPVLEDVSGHNKPAAVAPRIDLFLSGGGYRAALGSLGAIFFLLTDGGWPAVRRIISVSGGGIVNAHLALTRPEEADLPRELKTLFDDLTSRRRTLSVVGTAGILAFLGTSGFFGLVVLAWHWFNPQVPRWGWIILSVGIIFVLALAIRSFLRLALHLLYRRLVGTARLDALVERPWTKEHVFAATDLSAHGSLFFQTNAVQSIVMSSVRGVFDGRDVTFEKALRASTALPILLPPTKLRVRQRPTERSEREFVWDPMNSQTADLSIWLSDGGVTGNLGVQYLAVDLQSSRRIAEAKTLAGTSTARTRYTCNQHDEQLAWDCSACPSTTMVVDSSGLKPGVSRLWNVLLGIPLLGWAAAILRSIQVMYESGLGADQTMAGDRLVGVVRTEQMISRLARKKHPIDPSRDSKERWVLAGQERAFIEHSQEPQFRRALGYSDLLLACFAAREEAASVGTNLIAIPPERAARVVASGYLNALLNAYGPSAIDRADAGIGALSVLLGPSARLESWWQTTRAPHPDQPS